MGRLNHAGGATLIALISLLSWRVSGSRAAEAPVRPAPFAIEVIDSQTRRGVPLVELTTVSNVRFITDSGGVAVVDDPALFGHELYFGVQSHGYEYPADGFGMRGVRLRVEPGGVATLKINRLNIAERLYRITGEGVYRDSVILGRKVPVKEPLLNAEVTGQDSAQQAIYQGKIRWFFGDTNGQRYPLGQFGMSGATSLLPAGGGLDPAVGIDLSYFAGKDGFSRAVFEREGAHPIWAQGVFVLPDANGKERLVAMAQVMEQLDKVLARRLAVWNDEREIFETLKEIPLDVPLYPIGHPLRAIDGGVKHVYFGTCLPDLRVGDDWNRWQDFGSYEAFTCLTPGGRFEKGSTKLDRDYDGKLIWAWKKGTATLTSQEIAQLVKRGAMKPTEAWFRPLDVETQEPIVLGMGSVRWNAFRKRYVMIAGQIGGKPSYLGEVWYSEADKPEGPWRWARKIVTHDRYSFYNPVHHEFFDQDGGKTIYFQGTYTAMFSREGDLTPRYDYNQIMYRIDLGDERLKLPE